MDGQIEPALTTNELLPATRPRSANSARNYLLMLATIVALSIAYYFAVALPGTERAKLAFEREKYAGLRLCLDTADEKYWSYVKLNGWEVPGKPGTYTAAVAVWDHAAKIKKDALSECQVRYGK